MKHLERTSNIQELHYVTLYYDNLNALITKEFMQGHKAKLKQFLPDIKPNTNVKELLAVRILKHIQDHPKTF